MNPELIKSIEQVVRGELASVGWIVILVGLIAAGLGAFLGSYLKKKGEQRAINENFKKFLSQLETQTKATEEIRGEIAQKISGFTENLKADLQENLYYKTEILLPRLEAYKSLCALTYVVRRTRKEKFTPEEKRKLEDDLTSWYYESGNSIFLSLEAGKVWRSARNSLSSQSDDQIKTEFSNLRGQLKKDIKVYGEEDMGVKLGT